MGSATAWKQQNAAIRATEANASEVNLSGCEPLRPATANIAAQRMTLAAFEAYVVNQIVRKTAIAIEAAIVSGSGADEPTGILTGITFTATGSAPNKAEFTRSGLPVL